MKRLRVLVVDDSRASREHVCGVIDRLDTVEVVATASNGADALRLVRERRPDAVTLDLEMPQMDGFSFLRVLMITHPLPVIVVSSNSRQDSVIRALELGALDFVAKSPDMADFESVLSQKLRLLRSAKVVRPSIPVLARVRPKPPGVPSLSTYRAPRYVVGIASSTGGPGALLEIVSNLSGLNQFAFAIAQHMPPRFTTTFAERLDRLGAIPVAEARGGDALAAGRVLLCPGDRTMTVQRGLDGRLTVRLAPASPEDRYVPSASQLLASIGESLKVRAIGIVLTGMGDDGADGARVIAELGGRVYVESPNTAVISSMPEAALRAVPTAVECSLAGLPDRLRQLTEVKTS